MFSTRTCRKSFSGTACVYKRCIRTRYFIYRPHSCHELVWNPPRPRLLSSAKTILWPTWLWVGNKPLPPVPEKMMIKLPVITISTNVSLFPSLSSQQILWAKHCPTMGPKLNQPVRLKITLEGPFSDAQSEHFLILSIPFSEEGFESLQMRDMISELQSAIKVERQQSLSWMEKHNKVLYDTSCKTNHAFANYFCILNFRICCVQINLCIPSTYCMYCIV